jgi:hypothetical protein
MLVGTHPIVNFTVDNMKKRLGAKHKNKSGQRDYFARSFKAQQKTPDLVTHCIV